MIASDGGRRWSIWSIAIAAMFPLGIIGFSRTINDNSFLWHVRAGDAQRAAGAVLTQDPFTFTGLGKPWRTQSWLPELFYSFLDERFGLGQVPWITLACWVLFLTGVLMVIRSRCRSSFQTAVLAAMTCVIMIGFFNPRPVVFSFVLMILLVVADDRPQLRWSVPLIMWVWVASHGSFPIGAIYLVLQALAHRDRSRVAPLAVGGLLSLLTAHGVGVLQILRDFGKGGEALGVIKEWQTPDLLSVPFLPLLAAILLLIAWAGRGGIRTVHWWILVPFLALAFRANRTVPPAWIALLPILSLAAESLPIRLGVSRVTRAVPIGAAVVGLAMIPLVAVPPTLDPELFPLEAAARLEGDRVFASDAAGGYLTYRFWPDRLTYVDDRAELLHEELPEMVKVRGGAPEWRDVFERHGFDEALLNHEDPLTELLRLSGWDVVFQDENWVLLRPGA